VSKAYDRIKQRCAEDPEYRKKYLAMMKEKNQRARDRAKAKMTPEEIEERRKKNEEKRIAAIREANARRYGHTKPVAPKQERHPDLPAWKKDKPGRLLALCGWNGWS
jgi:hypothetical protein